MQVVSETKMKRRHSLLYWLCFIWVFDLLLWIFLTIPRLIFALLRPKRYKTVTKHKTMCVCQSCGYHWQAR